MRIAVLGCGSIGQRHLQNLCAFGQTDLLAFDPAAAAGEAVLNELGISRHATLDELWTQNPDVILVTAPTHLHVELALAAAQHNCHLFVEKPLSHSLDGVDILSAEVKRRNLITMVGCNMRFHPGPVQVKRLIGEGAIGKILAARIQTGSYLPGWRPFMDYRQSYSASAAQGGGAVLDCIHEIDLTLWYFGPGQLLSAACISASSIGLEVEGLSEILIQHESGALSSIHLNFVQRDYRRCCQIIGTDGTLYWDFQDGRVRMYRPEIGWQFFDQPSDWNINHMYIDEMQYFLECVERRVATFNDLKQGLETLRVALAVKEYIHNDHNK